MIPDIREAFNQSFTPQKYESLIHDLETYAGESIPFRIAESPVFVPVSLKQKLISACDEIIDEISKPGFIRLTERAIPPQFKVPGDEGHSMWLAFDFAICRNSNWQYEPQLIELQGFPSLFFYQHLLANHYRKHFPIPGNVSHLFDRSDEDFTRQLTDILLNRHHPENVILLEVEPEKQTTRIDFLATGNHTGIRSICISKIIREGRHLFYEHDGRKIPVYRIYNRVIFDELSRRNDLKCQFNLTEEVNVEWAGHPNWFFRISKFTMPFLKGSYVPETTFLHELKSIPGDLENYVLKPLFSFSGTGVIFHVTRNDIEMIKDPHNWILQRKVVYEPVIHSPDGNVKTEIRMLYSWKTDEEKPRLIINMARLSKGEMIGVKYNRNKTWVGGSVGFFET